MFRCALHGTICAPTASDQVILAHKVSQNPTNCVKILCHGCQAMKTSLPPPSKAVLGSDQHGNVGLLQCENTSHTAFLALAGLLITVSTKVTQALVELSAWRWLENILQIYLYVYWEQLENLESFVTTFSFFFFFFYHAFSVVSRMNMCGWVLQKGQNCCAFTTFFPSLWFSFVYFSFTLTNQS